MITKEIFNSATLGKNTSIQPLVLIRKGDILFYLSTTGITLDEVFWKPLLLNVPSIKESIDIEKRNYKISSVNLSISNSPYEGSRFSDEYDLIINSEVSIYFKTQNANILSDCILVYYGKVKRINQSQSKLFR